MKQHLLFITTMLFVGWQMSSITFAKSLKPMSDLQWNEIIKNKADTYVVQKGDTLWDMSKRLFGDAFYWPKIWSLNKDITNPNLITPGEKIVFFAGSSEALPKIGPQANSSSLLPQPKVIHEYDKVSQDLWKPLDIRALVAKDYDELGFERELRIRIPTRFTFRVPGFMRDSTIPSLGEVVASGRDAVRLSQYDIVFIKSDNQDLQVGSSYSILTEPIHVRERLSDRMGELYRTIGEVKVIGVKDKLYVGKVDFDYRTFQRGDRVYPLLPLILDINLSAAKDALDAIAVKVTNHDVAALSSQHDYVYLDRGIQDGVAVGNVFRFYEHNDPVTNDKLTDQNVMIRADAVVVYATAEFSTALIIHSYDLIKPGDLGILLTDVSGFQKRILLPTTAVDELDNLNDYEGVSDKEKTIIEQLENWDKTHKEATPELQMKAEPTTESLQPPEPLPKPEPEKKAVSENEVPEIKAAPTENAPNNESPPTSEPAMTPEEPSTSTQDLERFSPEPITPNP